MIRVGITGGMGCGKSTVVREFELLGVPCFVADTIAGAYYDNPDFVREIEQLFGSEIINSTGYVDKRRLASIVFADPTRLAQLTALIHPRVIADFDHFCSLHADAPYVVFESAILYEYHFDQLMDAVVCVYLDLEQRLSRLADRDHADRQALMARISNQSPAEETMLRADYVILNYEGNPRKRQVAYFHHLFSQPQFQETN